MIFKQFRYEPLGQASYIVGCMRSKHAFVVDPAADLGIDHYLLEAADLGLTIAGVLETHVHADFVSCARGLAARARVPHYLHEAAAGIVRYDITPIGDGEILELGRVRVEVMHTPGHTPEHCCFVVTDGARSEEPWAVLTGDCLFVGDVGRPDLLLADQAIDVMDEAERAEAQFRSIRERLFGLDDHVEVWPGHYGGSTCGGVNMSGKASSTIHFEKNFNLALQQPDAASFARFVSQTARPFPDDYARIKSINLGLIEAPSAVEVGALPVPDVEAEVARGAVVLDVRPALVFALGHIPGAVNMEFNRADLADRAELVVPEDTGLIVCAASSSVASAATDILRAAGYDVSGSITFEAWTAAGRPTASLDVISVDELRGSLDALTVVDARESFEFRYGHIPGAVPVPSTTAWEGIDDLPGRGPFAVVCGDQVRSALVASLILRSGRPARLVSGGMTDWLDRGFPAEKENKGAAV